MLEYFAAPVGSFMTNAYLLKDASTGESAVIDCPVYDAAMKNLLSRGGAGKLKYIILTHGHFDHICGVKELKDACGGEILIHENDADCLTDEKENMNLTACFAPFSPSRADRLLKEGDEITLGETVLRVMNTPGHTPGSCCFLTEKLLFSGDTLFKSSFGRIDFPRGSKTDMIASLTRLASLPDGTVVLPGHGEKTTIGAEKYWLR